MRIGLTGATGLVGGAILRLAHQRGHEVVAFSRNPDRDVEWAVETRRFHPEAGLDVNGCEAVIHLAGEPIPGLWNEQKRRAIIKSRIQGTRRVVEAIGKAKTKPEVFVCASAIGFYGDGGEKELIETSPAGRGFLAETAQAWEDEAMQAHGVRGVRLRISLVLSRKSGALPPMALASKCFVGAKFGDGQQWMSWIHEDDLARLALFAVEDMSVSGPINACSPWPVRNVDFVKTLGRVLHRPTWFTAPAWALRLALRGLSDELLQSKRVLPAAATEHGFGFTFPELEPALRDLV